MESWYILAPSLAPSQTTVTTKAWNTLPRSRMVVSFPRRQSIHSLEFSIITEFIDFIAPTTNDSGWDSTLHDLVYSGDEILECFTVSWEDVFRSSNGVWFVSLQNFGIQTFSLKTPRGFHVHQFASFNGFSLFMSSVQLRPLASRVLGDRWNYSGVGQNDLSPLLEVFEQMTSGTRFIIVKKNPS